VEERDLGACQQRGDHRLLALAGLDQHGVDDAALGVIGAEDLGA